MALISSDPPFCLPGKASKLIIGGVSGDTQRVRVKAAPPASKFYRATGEEVPLRTVLDAPERIGIETTIFEPDVSGKYVLVVEDVDAVPDRTPTYEGSPNALHTESILSRDDVDLYVSERMTFDIVAQGTSIQLLLYLNNQTVHATTPEVYGAEIGITPRLQNASNARALNAAQAMAPSELVGRTSNQLLGNPASVLDELAEILALHVVSVNAGAGPHHQIDYPSEALALASQGYPDTGAGFIEATGKLSQAFMNHIRRQDGYAFIHNVPDKKNTPIVQGAADTKGGIVLLSDLWRCIDLHLVQIEDPDSHEFADGYAMPSRGDLLEFIGDYLGELCQQVPTVSSTANPGAPLLAAWGFVSETPGQAQVT